MAHFQRLIFVVLVMLAAWLPASSYASFTATGGSVYFITSSGVSTGAKSTPAAACSAWVAGAIALDGYSRSVTWSTATVCAWYGAAWGMEKTVGISTSSDFSCPAGATLSGSSCTCGAGFTETGSACVSQADSTCAQLNSTGAVLTGMGTGLTLCLDGVTVKASGAAIGMKGGVNTGGNFFGPFSCPGTPCNGSPTAGEPVGAKDCKKSEIWVTMPGGGICVGADILKDGGSTNTVDPPSGAASSPGSGIPGAPAGTTSASKDTTCVSGSCTTTTTYKNGAGTVLGTSTETKPQPTFCQDNPASSVCVQSTLSASPCSAPDVCTGDAIQCAIEAQAKRTACALSPDPDGSDADYKAAKAKPLGSVTGNLENNSTVSIGPGNFDQSDALGGGSCIADRTVSVMGHGLVIPLSRVCVHLALLGNALLMFSFLLAGRIVVRG